MGSRCSLASCLTALHPIAGDDVAAMLGDAPPRLPGGHEAYFGMLRSGKLRLISPTCHQLRTQDSRIGSSVEASAGATSISVILSASLVTLKVIPGKPPEAQDAVSFIAQWMQRDSLAA